MSREEAAKRQRNTTVSRLTSAAENCDQTWQRQLAEAYRRPEELLEALRLPVPSDVADSAKFPLLVPRSFVARMKPADPHDPLLRQVLPTTEETRGAAGFQVDPVGDQSARTAPGLLHKYPGRALLIVAGACAVHCRYCFRREYPYHEEPRRLEDWEPALAALRSDPTISEVILSGGDPLMLTDVRLAELIGRLDQIEHLERLRIHTRLPIVLPARITDSLLQLLHRVRMQSIVVVHANHGNEIAGDCEAGLRGLVRSGLPVLNQAVLLRGINDSVAAIESLCRRLINVGVLPYYLHQLDRVVGAAHFESDPAVGRNIVAELRRRLPGYAVPVFVREIAGELSKTPVVDGTDAALRPAVQRELLIQ